MKETLDRINKMYLNNANHYCIDFDHAVYMFLNIAYMRETQRNSSPVVFPVDEVGKLLAEAVEAAILAYEETELECVNKEEQEEVDVDDLRQKAQTLYTTAKKCADFNGVVNSHFRAAAENVIGLGVTRKKIYISDTSDGCCRDVYKAFRAICKSWK